MKQPTAVLYDAPGPRARRVTAITSVLATVAVAALAYLLVVRPLAKLGQFSAEKWGPLVNPGNEFFPQVWQRLGQGFRATLIAAVLAIIASLVFGTALAILRLQLKALTRRRFTAMARPAEYALRGLIWFINGLTRLFIEVFRGIPVVIMIFFVWVGLPEFGISFQDNLPYLVIGLTIYNSVVIAEILRSGMEGLPGGQREAADAIGLTPFQTTRLVLLPQSFRIMLPALISQLVVVLKDTSLGFIIGYEEILRVSGQVISILENPIQTYAGVAVIYISVNYALSKLAQYVQRRLARGPKTAGLDTAAKPPAALAADASAGAVSTA
jgi:glutamate transport system permease protein